MARREERLHTHAPSPQKRNVPKGLLLLIGMLSVAVLASFWVQSPTAVHNASHKISSVKSEKMSALVVGGDEAENTSISVQPHDERGRPARKEFLGEYALPTAYTSKFLDLKQAVVEAGVLFGAGARSWRGGGVVGPSELDAQKRLDVIFKIILSKVDHSHFKLKDVKSHECVFSQNDVASSPPVRRKKRFLEPPETLSYQFMRIALDVLSKEGRVISPDCAVTVPPGYLASCLTYAFSTMRGRDLALFSVNTTDREKPSIFEDLKRFKHSQCARMLPCALWNSGLYEQSTERVGTGPIPDKVTIQNILGKSPLLYGAVSSILGHFGAHAGNLKELDRLLTLRKNIFYNTRHSDISPLLVSHRTSPFSSGGQSDGYPLYLSVDPETELLSVGTSPKAAADETVPLPQMSSATVFEILRMASVDWRCREADEASSSHRSRGCEFPKLIAFFGDSVERATFFALVSALRRGPEYVRSGTSKADEGLWSRYASWSTSAMYDGRVLHVVFDTCDTLVTTIVYPFMNEQTNGNTPMSADIKKTIDAAVERIIAENAKAFAVGAIPPYDARDIVASVLSPIRVGPSQLLQLGTLKWYIGLLKRLCYTDPTPNKALCPRLLTYFVFDMNAEVSNVELMHQDGGDALMDLQKGRTCGGKAVVNPFLKGSEVAAPERKIMPDGRSAKAVRWDESARESIELGLIMMSFGFWEQPEPSLTDRLHIFYASEFEHLLQRGENASKHEEPLYLHRLSSVYHHQKGRSRPFFEAFRNAYQTEPHHIFENVSVVRSDVDEHTRSSAWSRMRTNFTFLRSYDNSALVGIAKDGDVEHLPGLVMGYGGRKGWKLVAEQDTVLEPERRTREAIPFPKRDKVINPSRMRVQIERMLVEGWAALMQLSALVLDFTYNVLNVGPLPEIPKTVAQAPSYVSASGGVPRKQRHKPNPLNPISVNPLAQHRELFNHYRYTGDSGGLTLQYSNAQRCEIYTMEHTTLMQQCPIGGPSRSLFNSSLNVTQPKSVFPPALYVYDAALVQTLYPFTGTDIVHTDCHLSLNARRPERSSSMASENHVLMADWGFTAFFTSLHPAANEDGYEEGVPTTQVPPHTCRKSWSSIQPVCVDDNRTFVGDDHVDQRRNQTIVMSVDVSKALLRKYSGVLFHHYGCESNWTLNSEYQMAPTRPSIFDKSDFARAPPECSLMVGQTLSQCRNALSENELYLRLLHIMRARTTTP